MHSDTLSQLRHAHDFHLDSAQGERRTFYVVLLTAITMVVEVLAGYVYGSMALLADGWHMGTHVAALSISLFAYRYARRHAASPYFTFGTGKVSSLSGFASAVVLAMVALLMGAESLRRLFSPHPISFNEAIFVACLGLAVNLISAWLLRDHHDHHGHGHDDAHARLHHENEHHDHHDHNLRAAYLHVLADALTSVLAIVALLCGKAFGWIWMDALMGIVGALVIGRWSLGLIGETSAVLLDHTPEGGIMSRVQSLIEADADNRVADLHLWCVGAGRYAAIISLVTHEPREPEHYKGLLAEIDNLAHVTIEVNKCSDRTC